MKGFAVNVHPPAQVPVSPSRKTSTPSALTFSAVAVIFPTPETKVYSAEVKGHPATVHVNVMPEVQMSLASALQFVLFVGTTLTVNEEDDATPAWTATVSTDAAADPVTGNDPA